MRHRILFLAFVSASLTGCSAGTAELSGRVLVEEQPLTRGTVTLFTEDGRIFRSLLDGEGRYRVEGLPAGTVRFAVSTHPPIPVGFGLPQQLPPSKGAPHLAGPFPSRGGEREKDSLVLVVAERYTDPEESGLEWVVPEGGSHTYDIRLLP